MCRGLSGSLSLQQQPTNLRSVVSEKEDVREESAAAHNPEHWITEKLWLCDFILSVWNYLLEQLFKIYLVNNLSALFFFAKQQITLTVTFGTSESAQGSFLLQLWWGQSESQQKLEGFGFAMKGHPQQILVLPQECVWVLGGLQPYRSCMLWETPQDAVKLDLWLRGHFILSIEILLWAGQRSKWVGRASCFQTLWEPGLYSHKCEGFLPAVVHHIAERSWSSLGQLGLPLSVLQFVRSSFL